MAGFLAGSLDNQPATWFSTLAREVPNAAAYAERVQAAVGVYAREKP